MELSKTLLHLSQSNLEDFNECPRRFQLKVIENISWPAAYLEPLSQLEKATDIGNKFHQLCHQYFTGIDQAALSRTVLDPDLKLMWENFLSFASELKNEVHFSEIILSTPFLGHQLIAKYDFITTTEDGTIVIYDWKTSKSKPTRTQLSKRYQTFLYPFILSKAGNSIFDREVLTPDSISLTYWYPLSSDPEEIFPYSNSLYSENTAILTEAISKIDSYIHSGINFPLTSDQNHCRKCIYRSLCERGIQAGDVDPYAEIDQEDLSGFHFELEDISGIEY